MSQFTMALGAALAVPFSSAFLAPFALVDLAKRNQFFTYIPPGNGKVIVQGEDFYEFLMSYPGYHINRPDALYYDDAFPAYEVLPNGDTPDTYFDNRTYWKRLFGFYDVGWPGQRKVRRTKFRWKEEKGDEVDRRFAMTEVWKANKFAYIVEQVITTKDQYEVLLTYVVVVRITNPFIALIENEDWLVRLMAAVEESVRNWGGGFKFTQLISQTDGDTEDEKTREDFAKGIMKLNIELLSDPDDNPRGVIKTIGVTIDTSELRSPKPFGPRAEEFVRILSEPFRAEMEAKKTVIDATAKAEATTKLGAADAGAKEAMLSAEARGHGLKYRLAQESLDGASIINGGPSFTVTPSVRGMIMDLLGIFKRT